jgi:DNA-binding transcriptional LysR family regulator
MFVSGRGVGERINFIIEPIDKKAQNFARINRLNRYMSRSRVSLDQWRALLAVVDAGGYAQAAQRLHRSQSSVSYAVRQLEAALGVRAFAIEGRRAVLTPTGEMLVRRARFLLDEAAAIEQAARRLSAGWEAEVRLAVEVAMPTSPLLASLERFGAEGPGTRIELLEVVLGHLTDVLGRGEADLAIFGAVPMGYIGEPLMQLRFVLAANPAHPLHRLRRPLSMRDLRAHRHLVVRESSAERPTAPPLQATQRWTVSHMTTSIEAARAGYGFAWLPEEKIRPELEAGTLRPLKLRDGGERLENLYLIFADREHAGPATLRLAQIIRDTIAAAGNTSPPRRARHLR